MAGTLAGTSTDAGPYITEQLIIRDIVLGATGLILTTIVPTVIGHTLHIRSIIGDIDTTRAITGDIERIDCDGITHISDIDVIDGI